MDINIKEKKENLMKRSVEDLAEMVIIAEYHADKMKEANQENVKSFLETNKYLDNTSKSFALDTQNWYEHMLEKSRQQAKREMLAWVIATIISVVLLFILS